MSSLVFVAALAAQAATGGATSDAPAAAPLPSAAGPTGPKLGEVTFADLEAGAGYSTNPLSSIGSDTGSAFGRLSAHIAHTRVSARTTTVLSGYAQSMFYTHSYGSEQSFDINARHDAAVNEKLRLFVDADASYDRGGQLDTRIIGLPNVPLLPGTTVPPTLLVGSGDFLSTFGRTLQLGAHAGGQWTLSPRDFLDLSTGVDHSIFKNGNLESRYTTVPISIGYDRQINERTTIGGRVAAEFSHYSATRTSSAADISVVTPELTGQFRLSEQISLSGDAGVSFSKVDDGIRTRHSTGLAGDVNLCSTGERTQLCARASVQQEAATAAGPSREVSAGVDYSRRLSEDDTIQFSLSAQRYANPIVILSGISLTHGTYVRAAADYSRHFGHRLFGGLELAARKATQTGPDPKADLLASVFVRYRLGDLQ